MSTEHVGAVHWTGASLHVTELHGRPLYFRPFTQGNRGCARLNNLPEVPPPTGGRPGSGALSVSSPPHLSPRSVKGQDAAWTVWQNLAPDPAGSQPDTCSSKEQAEDKNVTKSQAAPILARGSRTKLAHLPRPHHSDLHVQLGPRSLDLCIIDISFVFSAQSHTSEGTYHCAGGMV